MAKRLMSTLFTAVLTVIVLEQTAYAQSVGTDICACQPSVYKFKLDFSLECTDSTVAGPGINNTACIVESRNQNENVTNPFPVTVSEVQVLELGRNLKVVGNSVYSGTFFDGDEISYTSVTLEKPDTIDANTIPRGFQIFITGVNSDEEPLVNQLVITYTNDCGIFPLLEVGDLIGWVNFTDLGKPAEEFCPIAGPDTVAPVSPPTESPVVAPTTNSTEAPVTPVMPPSCPPFESYDESTPKDIKGGSSKSGMLDIKGGTGGVVSSKAGKPPRSSKSGAQSEGKKGETESADSGSKKRRRLSVGDHCPEPQDSGYAVESKGSVPKSGEGKPRSSKGGAPKSTSADGVESTSENGMSQNKTESESMPSKMKERQLRQ